MGHAHEDWNCFHGAKKTPAACSRARTKLDTIKSDELMTVRVYAFCDLERSGAVKWITCIM